MWIYLAGEHSGSLSSIQDIPLARRPGGATLSAMTALSLALDTPDLARHYENVSADRQFKAGRALIEKLDIRAGQHVLDVGSGTGLLAAYVADVVGQSGSVVAIDPLPLRIEIAKWKARPNLSFRVGDAYELGAFKDESFDVVYLNAVFHWLPEKMGPLREFLRVLRPGGKLGISTGSKDHPNRIQLIRRKVLARAPYAEFPEATAGAALRVTATELRGLLTQAGFGVEQLDVLPNTNHHESAEAAIAFSEASSFGNFLGHLPESLRASARSELLRELDAIKTPRGIHQEGGRLLAVAVKPA
jgi:arsenite methyltransferase